MASPAISPSAPNLGSGLLQKQPAMVLDLNRLNALLQASSNVQKSLKGKNVASSVNGPLLVPETFAADLGYKQARVPTNLGISTSIKTQVIPQSGTSSTTSSWTNIVQNKIVQPLQFVEPIYADNVIKIPSHLLAIGRKKKSPVSVVPYTEGLYLLQFSDEASLSHALYGGPWHIGGIAFLLRKWEAGIHPVDFSTSLIPMWVQLKQVSFELLTTEGCTHSIIVSYSWNPQFCDVCNQWGHHSMACSLKKNYVQWVPKSAAVISDATAKSTSTIPCQSQVHILSAVPKEPLVISDPVISAGSKEPLVVSDPVDSTTIPLASVSVNSCSAPATDLESSLLISNVSKSADCTDLIPAQIDYVADLSTT
ncbi:hypothetical protein Tsubulata_028068 [Turnera subulata]|uniref:DUF4283 domain-containing protein n=1 Tax=Turnera subulata TaxID=218843 RepID=A0A9Q0J0T1_9ROSI|nr:hypothetical protein Tsubulata_028068 [Turnera subulata]